MVSALGLEAHPVLLAEMHSFGKALGVHGAVVVGSVILKEFLVNYARPLIYSTSLPLHRYVCVCVLQVCMSDMKQGSFPCHVHIYIHVPESNGARNAQSRYEVHSQSLRPEGLHVPIPADSSRPISPVGWVPFTPAALPLSARDGPLLLYQPGRY